MFFFAINHGILYDFSEIKEKYFEKADLNVDFIFFGLKYILIDIVTSL